MKRIGITWGIREKLTLLFFTVTVIAVVVNFLMVVPRLEKSLRDDRVRQMQRDASTYGPLFQSEVALKDPQLTGGVNAWSPVVAELSSSTGNRVAMYHVRDLTTEVAQLHVLTDPTNLADDGVLKRDEVAHAAVRSGRIASGIVDLKNGTNAQAASPLFFNGRPIGVVVYSTSLSGVTSIVEQQARRNLIAGIFALGISLLAGLLAARAIARRIRRLQRAARLVAEGNFTQPIPESSSDELGDLARAFNHMQERLATADRARKAFIANASHELRTPLFSLGGYVELMREEDLDEQTRREFLDTMHNQIHRMTKLATDLLDLSKIDTGSLDIQPQRVDVGDLARGVANEFEPVAAQHDTDISLVANGDLNARCDPDRLAQIVRILIDNALSHTPAGTDIQVSAQRQNGGVRLAVSDNGPGISAEDMPRLFERFHTGDKSGGTGLGLSIANELAHAMRTRLEVRSSPGNTTFEMTLPIDPGR